MNNHVEYILYYFERENFMEDKNEIYYAQFYTLEVTKDSDMEHLRRNADYLQIKKRMSDELSLSICDYDYNKIDEYSGKPFGKIHVIPDKKVVVVGECSRGYYRYFKELLSGESVKVYFAQEFTQKKENNNKKPYYSSESGSYYRYTPKQKYYCLEIKPLSLNRTEDVQLIVNYYKEYGQSQNETCESTSSLQEIIEFCKKTVEEHPDKLYTEYIKDRETVKSLIKRLENKK